MKTFVHRAFLPDNMLLPRLTSMKQCRILITFPSAFKTQLASTHMIMANVSSKHRRSQELTCVKKIQCHSHCTWKQLCTTSARVEHAFNIGGVVLSYFLILSHLLYTSTSAGSPLTQLATPSVVSTSLAPPSACSALPCCSRLRSPSTSSSAALPGRLHTGG